MKKALLVIDMINDFIDPEGALFIGDDGRYIINPIVDKINEYKKENMPVFVLSDNHSEDDPEFKLFPKHAVRGTWGSRLVPEIREVVLTDAGSEYTNVSLIGKTTYDAFFQTSLLSVLKYYKIDTVEIVGCCTSICVGVTAIEAAKNGLKAEIPESCVADFDKNAHEFFLGHLKTICGANITE